MTPASEKAAPIPAEVVDAVVQFILSSRGLCHEGIEAMVTAGVQAGIKLADREARPSLPDSREERIREDAARLDWLETNSNVEVTYDGWEDNVWNVHVVNGGRSDREWTKIAESSSLRDAIDLARARQGGNNG